MPGKMLKPKEVCARLGVKYATLRRWIEAGHIKAIRTVSGRYIIPESEVNRILEEGARKVREERARMVRKVRAVVYARVSSHDQKEDLERQVKYLQEYCASKGYRVVEVLTDVASGLKTDREGLRKLFDIVASRQAEVVVIAYKDRLTRFCFKYLEYFFNQFGARVEVVYGEEPKDAHRELIEDLRETVRWFTGKLEKAFSSKP